MSEFVKQVTYGELKDTVANNDVVLIDFFATWCGPCKMLAPELDKAAQKLQGKAVFVKVDVDAEVSATMEYGVQAMPTLVVIKSGKEVVRKLGYMNAQAIEELVSQAF